MIQIVEVVIIIIGLITIHSFMYLFKNNTLSGLIKYLNYTINLVGGAFITFIGIFMIIRFIPFNYSLLGIVLLLSSISQFIDYYISRTAQDEIFDTEQYVDVTPQGIMNSSMRHRQISTMLVSLIIGLLLIIAKIE